MKINVGMFNLWNSFFIIRDIHFFCIEGTFRRSHTILKLTLFNFEYFISFCFKKAEEEAKKFEKKLEAQ